MSRGQNISSRAMHGCWEHQLNCHLLELTAVVREFLIGAENTSAETRKR